MTTWDDITNKPFDEPIAGSDERTKLEPEYIDIPALKEALGL